MKQAPIPLNEVDRQASLDRMNLISTPREADLDRITRLAKEFFDVETVAVSLIDGERQWFKSRCGLDVTETSRDISFCGHAIAQDGLLLVDDATADERFHDNPLVVAGPNIRFYAGRPLRNREGHAIGTLCLISSNKNHFDEEKQQALDDFGHIVQLSLEARVLSESQSALMKELDKAKRDAMICPLCGLWNRAGLDNMFERELQRAIRQRSKLGVAVIDIDHFKTINDSYGHAIGDEAIKLAAEVLTRAARRYDIVGRHGGEEFMLIMPGAGREELDAIGGRLVRNFREQAHLPIPVGKKHPFTISIGLAAYDPNTLPAIEAKALFELADQAMYAAKQDGRDNHRVAIVQ